MKVSKDKLELEMDCLRENLDSDLAVVDKAQNDQEGMCESGALIDWRQLWNLLGEYASDITITVIIYQ